MNNPAENDIRQLLDAQRAFFATGLTRELPFRLQQLRTLKKAIFCYRKRIEKALWDDLHKSPEEAYLTEISLVTGEIANHLRHLKRWTRTRRVSTPLHLLPSSSRVLVEPLGVSLIVSPWNYPFQLLFNPLVGAISAGCCAVLKPSPYTPAIAEVMEQLVNEFFDPGYITLVQGGREVNALLWSQRFDLIFYTGSPAVGHHVMQAAAANLTPVILELGGKSPCIVDTGAHLERAARRIAWGKLINAGQTCIAPDYLFVQKALKDELLTLIDRHIKDMYGEDIRQSRYYPRIVNDKAVERLSGLMKEGRIVRGGEVDAAERFIAPTIIDGIDPSHPVMQEEIFGPILPVMTFEEVGEALGYINRNEKPLAFYYFGKNKKAKEVLARSTSGGACINDNLLHFANHHLPLGGVGNSGMGKYHGRDSLLAFSNRRGVVSTPVWIDLKFRYVPFPNFRLIERILGR
ncbi:MAG: aldehyde dehydrogenase family protein [Bacteroidota bacterium]